MLATDAETARKNQDLVVAKTYTERKEAERIYELKKSNHIQAKKDRAAINKNVKITEKAP